MHAVWHLSGHPRTLWNLVDGGVAAPIFYGKATYTSDTVFECAQLALLHLDLPPSQKLFVAGFTPRSNTAAARGGASIDVIVVAHNNVQAGAWAQAVSAGRWLTAGMLLEISSHFFAEVRQAPAHIDAVLAFADTHMISPQICTSPPLYADEGTEWPSISDKGDFANVKGIAPPDMQSRPHDNAACNSQCNAGFVIPDTWTTLRANPSVWSTLPAAPEPAAKRRRRTTDASPADEVEDLTDDALPPAAPYVAQKGGWGLPNTKFEPAVGVDPNPMGEWGKASRGKRKAVSATAGDTFLGQPISGAEDCPWRTSPCRPPRSTRTSSSSPPRGNSPARRATKWRATSGSSPTPRSHARPVRS